MYRFESIRMVVIFFVVVVVVCWVRDGKQTFVEKGNLVLKFNYLNTVFIPLALCLSPISFVQNSFSSILFHNRNYFMFQSESKKRFANTRSRGEFIRLERHSRNQWETNGGDGHLLEKGHGRR